MRNGRTLPAPRPFSSEENGTENGIFRSGIRIGFRVRRGLAGLVLTGSVLLAGCGLQVPSPLPPTEVSPTARPVGQESRELRAYYGRVQASLLAQGLLRTDGGGPDVPFTARNLVDNFVALALHQEYDEAGGRLVARQSASRLHRWAKPITMTVRHGDTIPLDQRRTDTAEVLRFSARLTRVTGLPITQAQTDGNFHVFFLNEAERRAIAPEIRRIMPGVSNAVLDTVVNMPRTTYCLAFASDPQRDGTYDKAVVIIRGEHPDLLRQSCIHEELAQALGLANDSPRARPSIFNDDEEFGLLTAHDEILLRMLYDQRLRPGMTEAEARPIIEILAAEQGGGTV